MSVVGNEVTCAGNRCIGTDRDGIGPELRSLRCSRRVHGRDCQGPEQYPDASTSPAVPAPVGHKRRSGTYAYEDQLMATETPVYRHTRRTPTQRSAGRPRLTAPERGC